MWRTNSRRRSPGKGKIHTQRKDPRDVIPIISIAWKPHLLCSREVSVAPPPAHLCPDPKRTWVPNTSSTPAEGPHTTKELPASYLSGHEGTQPVQDRVKANPPYQGPGKASPLSLPSELIPEQAPPNAFLKACENRPTSPSRDPAST